MDSNSLQIFDALEKWYRSKINKRRTQGAFIAAGLVGSYALGPLYLAIASLGTVSLLSWRLFTPKSSNQSTFFKNETNTRLPLKKDKKF